MIQKNQVPKIKPQTSNDPNREMALTWYYIAWHNKIKSWNNKKKKVYAKEISKIMEGIPIQTINNNRDAKEINNYLRNNKIKHFEFKEQRFVVKDGKTSYQITPLNLYSLFVYLIDSISKGLSEKTGFEYIKTAKAIIKKEQESEK